MGKIKELYERWQRFFAEVKAEMKKVTYPTREEVVGTTVVVIVTSVIFAIYLFLVDFVVMKGYSGFVRIVGS